MAKKIGAIVSLSIIGVLILATIIMANININYSVKCATPDRVYVQVKDGSLLATEEQERYIVDLISNASKQNSLVSLFNGEIDKYAKLVTENKKIGDPSNFYVRYKYNVEQKLVENDKIVKDSNGKDCVYQELVFDVKLAEAETEINVYVIPDSERPFNYSHYFKLDANFVELNNYLNLNF